MPGRSAVRGGGRGGKVGKSASPSESVHPVHDAVQPMTYLSQQDSHTRRLSQIANRALTAPTPSLMIPRRTLLKAARLAAAATIIRPAFADSELDSLVRKGSQGRRP